MPFIGAVEVKEEDNADFWDLTKGLKYCSASADIEVDLPFTTDFASIPRVVVWLLPRYGVYTKAAIVHDWLCDRRDPQRIPRNKADQLFREMLQDEGVSVLRQWLMWVGVRIGGRLKETNPVEFLLWLLIAVPAVVFLVVPVTVVFVWLVLFWLLDWLVTALAALFVRLKPLNALPAVHRPRFDLLLSKRKPGPSPTTGRVTILQPTRRA